MILSKSDKQKTPEHFSGVFCLPVRKFVLIFLCPIRVISKIGADFSVSDTGDLKNRS